MLNASLLFLSVIFMTGSNVGTRMNKSTNIGAFLNSAFVAGIAAVLLWSISAILHESISNEMFIYALIFAFLGVIGKLAGYIAYQKGSMAGTTLFANSSLIIVVLFSVLYFQERFDWLSAMGIIGTLVSLTLFALPEKKERDDKKENRKKSVNFIWIFACVITLLANSGISISTKIRQMKVEGEGPFAYMAFCYTLMFVISITIYSLMQIRLKSLRTDISNIKASVSSLLLQSFGNSGCNLLVTILSSRIPGSILYPVNTGGGLILTAICGFVFFKEKKTRKNMAGIILGIFSIVLLTI